MPKGTKRKSTQISKKSNKRQKTLPDVNEDKLNNAIARLNNLRSEEKEEIAREVSEADLFNFEQNDEPSIDRIWNKFATDNNVCKIFTSFTFGEVAELFNIAEPYIRDQPRRQGRRSRVSNRDRFCLMLIWFATGDTYNKIGATWDIEKSHLKDLISKTVKECEPALYARLVPYTAAQAELSRSDDFPDARLIIDTTFHPTTRPSGSDEQRLLFSGKHKRHGVKHEVWHSMAGMALKAYGPFVGSKHDFSIFEEHKDQVINYLKKVDMDGSYQLLVDSGYQGAQSITGLSAVVSPKKARGTESLTLAEANQKVRIGRTRVICENYYGRMKKKFKLMCFPWRGERGDDYRTAFAIALALTNYSVSKKPLRRNRLSKYSAFLKKLYLL